MNKEMLNQLYRYGISLTNNEANAFDLVQSAIEKYLIKKPGEPVSLKYIRKIMRNQFIDQCRRNNIIPFEPLDDHAPLLSTTHELESMVIDHVYIHQVMDELTTLEREVLFLWAVEEHTAQEIADELQAPRNTILSRLFRVKRKARDIITRLDRNSGVKEAES
ncbi:sigma-70 family RNA polymerase sigma factor [Aliikangiella coralliicola]|uniref:Sigma-70 family RNA polymerase sigma factor n=1 Tax=Aliikangiella coralliicola TaxID=2592383 RepID=A0A545UCX5_9GAMM|nr:sigma-70 family RNA polymerase sigma factor [Aliikangiella coralliicola]TQV87317.1 sigma-70 family RNA polymerase sigma factor [Aliikangiella coralliicola]